MLTFSFRRISFAKASKYLFLVTTQQETVVYSLKPETYWCLFCMDFISYFRGTDLVLVIRNGLNL